MKELTAVKEVKERPDSGSLLAIGHSLFPVFPRLREFRGRGDGLKIPSGEHIVEKPDQFLVDQSI